MIKVTNNGGNENEVIIRKNGLLNAGLSEIGHGASGEDQHQNNLNCAV